MDDSNSPDLIIESLLGELPVPAFLADAHGFCRRVSAQWGAFLGSPLQPPVGQRWFAAFAEGSWLEAEASRGSTRDGAISPIEVHLNATPALASATLRLIPLRDGRHQRLGALGIVSPRGTNDPDSARQDPMDCSPWSTERLAKLVGSIACALRVERDLERHAEQQKALGELSCWALAHGDAPTEEALENLCQVLLERVVQATGAVGAALVEFDANDGPRRWRAVVGLPKEQIRQAVESQSLTSAKTPAHSNLEHWSALTQSAFRELEANNGMCVAIPTESEGSAPGGVMGVYCSDETAFGDSDMEFLSAAARVVAGAIRQSREAEARSRAQKQLVYSEKMDAIGRLAGGVAHDFNNLLGIVLGYAEAVAETLPPGDPNREDLASVIAAAHRGTELTHQLLTLSRRQLVSPREVGVGALVQDQSHRISRLVGDPIRVEIQVADAAWKIRIDPAELDRALNQLVANARDAMPTGGRLVISVRSQTLEHNVAESRVLIPKGHYVVLSIEDTGAGLDEQSELHLFEPFFSTKATGHGLGLGLASVYGIVHQAGGYLVCRSARNRGTTFQLYFPAVSLGGEQTAASPSRTHLCRPTAPSRILLVEDDLALRELLERMLRRAGYQVLVASDALHALDLVLEQHEAIDLLLTDVVMPDLNGHELAQQITAVYPELDVLFISGYTDNILSQDGMLTQGTKLLHKPFTEQQLHRALADILSGTESALDAAS